MKPTFDDMLRDWEYRNQDPPSAFEDDEIDEEALEQAKEEWAAAMWEIKNETI